MMALSGFPIAIPRAAASLTARSLGALAFIRLNHEPKPRAPNTPQPHGGTMPNDATALEGILCGRLGRSSKMGSAPWLTLCLLVVV
jgi:hypothetical protein